MGISEGAGNLSASSSEGAVWYGALPGRDAAYMAAACKWKAQTPPTQERAMTTTATAPARSRPPVTISPTVGTRRKWGCRAGDDPPVDGSFVITEYEGGQDIHFSCLHGDYASTFAHSYAWSYGKSRRKLREWAEEVGRHPRVCVRWKQPGEAMVTRLE